VAELRVLHLLLLPGSAPTGAAGVDGPAAAATSAPAVAAAAAAAAASAASAAACAALLEYIACGLLCRKSARGLLLVAGGGLYQQRHNHNIRQMNITCSMLHTNLAGHDITFLWIQVVVVS
jgi:hypothetical protein